MPLQPSKSENMLWNSRSIGEIQEQGHLEVETKFEISSGDFDRLQTIGNVRRCERQLNVYYDAHWKLADSACTLRIRLANYSSPILALKVPVSKAGEQRVMREFEVLARDLRLESGASLHPTKIDAERELPDELQQQLARFGVRHLQRVGWVRNTRLTVEVQGIGAVELDRTKLPDGTVAHEAEIESPDAVVQRKLAVLVRHCAYDAKPSHVSKFERFRRAALSLEAMNRTCG